VDRASGDFLRAGGPAGQTSTGKSTLLNVLEWCMSCVVSAARSSFCSMDQMVTRSPGLWSWCCRGWGEAGAATGEAVGSGEQRGILYGLFPL
jgi:hypothetical protein